MGQIEVTGMVMSTSPIGEYDRRVVLLTREHGKVAAFARGARKPNSPLVGAVTPFSFGQFTLYEGRSSYSIDAASIQNYFEDLKADLVGTYYGYYFLEFASYYTREEQDESEMLKLLYQTLKALMSPNIPDELVRAVFELKAMCVEGEGPQVFQCVSCGSAEGPMGFSVKKGGLVCAECEPGVGDVLPLNPSTVYTMQFIEKSAIEHLYTFGVREDVLSELRDLMQRYLAEYVGKDFKSLEILKTVL